MDSGIDMPALCRHDLFFQRLHAGLAELFEGSCRRIAVVALEIMVFNNGRLFLFHVEALPV